MPRLSTAKVTLSELQKSHVALLDAIDRLGASARQYQRAKPLIQDFQAALFHHFALQKDDVYRMLAADDEESVKIVESLKVDLNRLKVASVEFFDRYPADLGDVNPIGFPMAFQHFSQDIRARIYLEEQHFVPLIRKRIKSDA